MVNPARLRTDFDKLVDTNGQPVRVRYYTTSYSGTQYDQEYITASGNDVWIQAMHFPLNINTGGADREYLEQGKILINDRKLYVAGSIEISSTTKIMFGSPTVSSVFAPIENGWMDYQISGTVIYNKMFIRTLTNGSFINEV